MPIPADVSPGVAAAVLTKGVKTAISIPEDVFQQAERLARRSRKSRSRSFSDAMRE
jgi:metal-responsive CopG/Arc/MetJ family transcriptional regulator